VRDHRTAARLAALAAAALALAACNQMRPAFFMRGAASREDRNRQFVSPIEPIAERNLGLPQIREKLQARTANVKSLRANLDLVAGAGKFRQQFAANLFVQPSGFLRVRGSQNQGTVFDILVRNEAVQFVIFSDRTFYQGSLDELRANPEILAGIYPEQLIQNFAVEQTLLRRLKQYPDAMLYRDRGHYIIRFDYAGGVSERYHLRETDLLADLYERYDGEQRSSFMRFWAYQIYDGKYLLPSQFVVESPRTGGRFSATVTEMRVNESLAPALAQLEIPQNFTRMNPR
jgi:hypothetical protein